MTITAARALRLSVAALAATALAACAERTPGPTDTESGPSSDGGGYGVRSDAAIPGSFPELGICQDLQAPPGSTLVFNVLGKGVQIYRWDGTTWRFVDPEADLFADADGNGLVGTHFGGPTWLTLSGSRVVGTVSKRCSATPTAIDWLLLDAAPTGAGVFEHTKFIQRLNTVGGNAPTRPGRFVGEEVRVRYTADYLFYTS